MSAALDQQTETRTRLWPQSWGEPWRSGFHVAIAVIAGDLVAGGYAVLLGPASLAVWLWLVGVGGVAVLALPVFVLGWLRRRGWRLTWITARSVCLGPVLPVVLCMPAFPYCRRLDLLEAAAMVVGFLVAGAIGEALTALIFIRNLPRCNRRRVALAALVGSVLLALAATQALHLEAALYRVLGGGLHVGPPLTMVLVIGPFNLALAITALLLFRAAPMNVPAVPGGIGAGGTAIDGGVTGDVPTQPRPVRSRTRAVEQRLERFALGRRLCAVSRRLGIMAAHPGGPQRVNCEGRGPWPRSWTPIARGALHLAIVLAVTNVAGALSVALTQTADDDGFLMAAAFTVLTLPPLLVGWLSRAGRRVTGALILVFWMFVPLFLAGVTFPLFFLFVAAGFCRIMGPVHRGRVALAVILGIALLPLGTGVCCAMGRLYPKAQWWTTPWAAFYCGQWWLGAIRLISGQMVPLFRTSPWVVFARGLWSIGAVTPSFGVTALLLAASVERPGAAHHADAGGSSRRSFPFSACSSGPFASRGSKGA